VDLLTVLEHEFGHILGYQDNTGDGIMGQVLALGVRRTPTTAALDQAFANPNGLFGS
jgi:hypothetical protein